MTRRTTLAAAVAGGMAVFCGGGPALAADGVCRGFATSGAAAEQIRALEEAGARGNVAGSSLEAGEEMLGPGYVSMGPDGSVTTREGALARWSVQPWASAFAIKELDIKVYCDTAIVVGLAEAQRLNPPPDAKPVHFRWLNVWTKTGETWRLGASSFARF